MTIRENIIQYIRTTALAPVVGVTGVYRSRADRFSVEESPAINVVVDSESGNEDSIGKIYADLSVEIQVYQRGEEPDSLADPIVDQVHALMTADATLGGLSYDVLEAGTTWDFDEADRTALIVRMRYSIRYRHNRTSLSS